MREQYGAMAQPLGIAGKLEHETGLEPATTTLATWSSTN
jgi:hypothetical protein